jgi:hypothetical protein
MKRHILALLCPLLLSACSAEVAVETPPQTQSIPVTSVGEPVYAEVAVDLPPETQNVDVIIRELYATLTVVNPSQSFTLTTSARLSFTGTATPDKPVVYGNVNKPAYYNSSEVLIAEQSFAPSSRTPMTMNGLSKAIGKKRIWIIVANTVTQANGVPINEPPPEIQLENVVLHATVSKYFHWMDGALSVGGL